MPTTRPDVLSIAGAPLKPSVNSFREDRCGGLAASGHDLSQTILVSGGIGGVASERVVQCPHPAAAQIEIKVKVELAGRGLVSPHSGRRLLGSLCRGPEQASCRRLIQPDQLFCLRSESISRRSSSNFWSRSFQWDLSASLLLTPFDFCSAIRWRRACTSCLTDSLD